MKNTYKQSEVRLVEAGLYLCDCCATVCYFCLIDTLLLRKKEIQVKVSLSSFVFIILHNSTAAHNRVSFKRKGFLRTTILFCNTLEIHAS